MKHLSSLFVVLTTAAISIGAPIDSAVHIRRDTKEGWNAGSGTVIANSKGRSLILTVAHVVPDAGTKLTVTHGENKYEAKYVAGSTVKEVLLAPGIGTLEIDGPDLAIIEVEAVLPVAEFAAKPAQKGDVVRQFGYAGGGTENGPKEKLGKVIDPDAFWALPDARRGDSGCALFNADGKIIGVCHSRSADPNEVGVLAHPLTTVTDWLKDKVGTYPALHKTLNPKEKK